MLIINARIVSMSDKLKQLNDSKSIVTFENGIYILKGILLRQ